MGTEVTGTEAVGEVPRPTCLRILHCTWGYHPDAQGGAEHQAQLQAEELSRRGHSVEVVCPRWPDTKTGATNGVLVHRIRLWNRRRFKTATYALSLAWFLLANLRRFDVAHVHLAYFQADVVALVARLYSTPVWVKVAASGPHGELARMGPAAFVTRFIGVRWATRVQAVSSEIEKELLEIGVPADRIVRMPNGVDLASFKPVANHERRALRARLDIPVDTPCALFVGRLARHKGIPELVEVWSQFDPRTATLILVGSMSTMDSVAQIPRNDSILVRDWTPDIRSYLHASDVFVLPSHVEGMSNALLEAMACGLAVVATAVGSTPDLIENRRTGLLVEVGDVAGLRDAIAALLCDPGLRQRLGAAAVIKVREYSIDSVVDQLVEGYTALLKRS